MAEDAAGEEAHVDEGARAADYQAEAEAAGCSSTLIRSSSSGGLHAFIQLPQFLKAHHVHHIGRELVARAGMTPKDGTCEIFPSEMPWVPGAKTRSDYSRSRGVRLPGGKGSALIVDGAANP